MSTQKEFHSSDIEQEKLIHSIDEDLVSESDVDELAGMDDNLEAETVADDSVNVQVDDLVDINDVMDEIHNEDLELNEKDVKNQKNEPKASLPRLIMIGYMKNIKKDALITWLESTAEKYFDAPRSGRYYITKYKKGLAYELHEGGTCGAYLPSIIKHFRKSDDNRSVVIPTSTLNIEVTERESRLNSYRLLEDDDSEPSPEIKPSSIMTPIFKAGTGIFVFGLLVACLGVISLFGAVVFKYIVYNYKEKPEIYHQINSLPHEQAHRLSDVSDDDWVVALTYKNKQWTTVKNSDKAETAPKAKKTTKPTQQVVKPRDLFKDKG